jgi:hypothetical protein
MEFTAEKTFVFTGNDNAQSKGTYTISDDGKFLTLMPENSDATFIDTIREISATRLVLIDKNGNQLVNTK